MNRRMAARTIMLMAVALATGSALTRVDAAPPDALTVARGGTGIAPPLPVAPPTAQRAAGIALVGDDGPEMYTFGPFGPDSPACISNGLTAVGRITADGTVQYGPISAPRVHAIDCADPLHQTLIKLSGQTFS